MGSGEGNDYQLSPLPKPLERRLGWLSSTGMVALFTPIVLIGVSIDSSRVRPAFLIGGVVVMVVSITANRLIYRSIPGVDRATMTASQRRVLDPLEPPDPSDPHGAIEMIRIDLKLIRRALRKHPDRSLHVITLDSRGLTVPAWAMCWKPRSVKRSGVAELTIEWINIETWYVRSDSDGPDTYEIETRQPWYDTGSERWPAFRIDRSRIADEVLMLEAVRSIGQISIELETSVNLVN